MPPKDSTIPAKQRRTRFVKEFLRDRNATKAARAAGYKQPHVAGCRLLKDVKVAAQIEAHDRRMNKKYELDAERVKKEIARLAFFDPRNLFNDGGSMKEITELDDDTARIIAGFDITELFEGDGKAREQVGYIKKFKLPDKTRALELAMRHLKMLTDRIEVSADETVISLLQRRRNRLAKEKSARARQP